MKYRVHCVTFFRPSSSFCIFSIVGMGALAIESLFRGDNEVFLSLTLVTLLLKYLVERRMKAQMKR